MLLLVTILLTKILQQSIMQEGMWFIAKMSPSKNTLKQATCMYKGLTSYMMSYNELQIYRYMLTYEICGSIKET